MTGACSDGKIGVVVPVFNKLNFLIPSIGSIVAAARHDGHAEVVVLDHGSTDGSRAFLETQGGIRLYAARGGTIGELRNAGAALTDADVMLFLDSDVLVPVDYLARVREALASTRASVIGCEVGMPVPAHWIEDAWYRLVSKSGDGPRPYLNAASFAVTRKAFDEVGGFAPGLVTGEDSELCRRLSNHGYAIVQVQSLEVVHLDNPRTIPAFFRKERWRGLGALKAAKHVRIDRVLAMTVAWALLVPVGTLLLLRGAVVSSPPLACLGMVSLLAIPVATYCYRVRASGRWAPVGRALVLIVVFYAGRLAGLFQSLGLRPQIEHREPLVVVPVESGTRV